MNEILIFVLFLLIPLIYHRCLYYTFRGYFKESKLRRKTNLQIHHLHFGAIFILITAFLLILLGKNIWVVALLGLGLGLIFDEFIPALLMPGNRKVELKAYEKGFIATLILFIFIIALLVLFYWVLL